jgi:hypothetical protein
MSTQRLSDGARRDGGKAVAANYLKTLLAVVAAGIVFAATVWIVIAILKFDLVAILSG